MATLTPKHSKMEPLRIPCYLFSQVLEVAEITGVENTPSSRRQAFFRPDAANNFSDRIRDLLDNEELLVASFATEWWATKVAKVLVLNSVTASEVAAYINHDGYRHFYFGVGDVSSAVSEEDLSFEPVSESIETQLADLSAFMKISNGFWLYWG